FSLFYALPEIESVRRLSDLFLRCCVATRPGNAVASTCYIATLPCDAVTRSGNSARPRASTTSSVLPGHGSAPRRVVARLLPGCRPQENAVLVQPLDLTENFLSLCSSRTRVRWSVLRIVSR